MKKRVLCMILTLVMIFSIVLSATAASNEATEAAEALYELGLFKGTGTNPDGTPIFALDKTPTRNQAIIMLVRLLGKEEEAKAGTWDIPFTDVSDAMRPYIGYAYANGLTNGFTATTYCGTNPIKANQYITFVLRSLGYTSGADFQVSTAWEFSDKIGLTDGRYNQNTTAFTRGDVAIISNSALSTKTKNSTDTLLSALKAQGIGQTTPIKQNLSLEEVRQLAGENHAVYTRADAKTAMNIDQYAISDKALLTQTEMDSLRTERAKAATLSIEQALEDTDLFFRTWKYSYPSYYFMGEELFASAQKKVVANLSARTGTITGKEFGDILYEAMSFLQDDHSSIDGKSPAEYEDDLFYVSYLDNTQVFMKDETGYYQTINGAKWYFTSSSNKNLRIEPTLLPSGKVAYCPMLLIQKSEKIAADRIILKHGAEAKEITLRWTMSKDVSYQGIVDSQCSVKTSGDIYYIDYLDMHSDVGDVNDFLKTAKEAKKYKAVIFDLRHTIGWEHWQLVEWIKAFTGETPSVSAAFLTRNNALRTLRNYKGFESAAIGKENSKTWYDKGRESSNDIPLIILTDKSVLSSIEEACLYLRTIENSVVIGTNTKGCSQGGSVQTYYLPYSGVQFAIGGFMKFQGESKNIDGLGYEPDIWCNPEDALTSALMFLQYYGLADQQSVQPLYRESTPPANLRILWHGSEILPGQVFGDIPDRGDDNVLVTVDGKQVTDFTVTSNDPATMRAEKVNGGKIRLTRLKSFGGKFIGLTIHYDGKDYGFACND